MFLGIDVGLRNLSYCLLTGKGRLACWSVVDLLEWCPGHQTTPDALAMVLPALFKDFVDLHVGIESQPRWNRPMWLLSHIVFRYFRARLWHHGVRSVRFLRAHRKYNAKWLAMCSLPPDNFCYTQRKCHSVQICRALAAKYGIPLDRFEKACKKDDLADSLLMAFLLVEDIWPAWRKNRLL